MSTALVMNGLLKICAFFSGLAGITLLWLVGSLPLVTIPAATVAVTDAVIRLRNGESPTWRRFLVTMREHIPSSAVGLAVVLIPAAAACGLVMVVQQGGGPMASGAALAAILLTAVIASVVPYGCLTASSPVVVPHHVARTIARRPFRAMLSVAPYGAMAFLLAVVPSSLFLIVAVVSVSLPAFVSVAILTAERRTSQHRTRNSQSFLHIITKGITQ